jgi:hypothetical protein
MPHSTIINQDFKNILLWRNHNIKLRRIDAAMSSAKAILSFNPSAMNSSKLASIVLISKAGYAKSVLEPQYLQLQRVHIQENTGKYSQKSNR